MVMDDNLFQQLNDSIAAKKTLLSQKEKIFLAKKKIYNSIIKEKKIFFCGNGGSASDAQHLTAELLIRLRPKVNRRSIPAICLHMDSSTITACSNDYSYDDVFSRPLSALGKSGDILIVISTSGNSKNILKVLKEARKKNIYSIGFLGNSGGRAKKLCHLPILVKSKVTARIQETHIFLGHHILEQVENKLIKNKKI
jgi:D-sedoheptulose 7-phosphate isomerase